MILLIRWLLLWELLRKTKSSTHVRYVVGSRLLKLGVLLVWDDVGVGGGGLLVWLLFWSVGVAVDVVLAGGRLKLLSKMCC